MVTPWYESGAADVILGMEDMIQEPAGRDAASTAKWTRMLQEAHAQRRRGVTGVVSLRRHADLLRAGGESVRAWRVEAIAQAIADHPEEPLP